MTVFKTQLNILSICYKLPQKAFFPQSQEPSFQTNKSQNENKTDPTYFLKGHIVNNELLQHNSIVKNCSIFKQNDQNHIE